MIQQLSNIKTIYTSARAGASEYHNASLVWEDDKILWLGEEKNLPSAYKTAKTWNGNQYILVPGLIDCHTHLVFAGWRANEFEQKILGKTYLEIAEAGGGILSTVAKTRAASESELSNRAFEFLREMSALGVTTVECKSGYGLNLEAELKQLRVYRDLMQAQPVELIVTLLAAHTIPPEWAKDPAGYVKLICEKIIPQVAEGKLATFCDVYVEKNAFSREQAETIWAAAKKFGLKLKIHADQFSNGGGAVLAAAHQAVSADHLEFTSEQGFQKMADAGVVAVLLPLASLYTRQPFLNARKILSQGVKLALATDFNPGSAPSYHLPLAMMLACNLHQLTPQEALEATTINAAQALNVADRIGSLEPGKQADFALIEAENLVHWMYHFRPNACLMTIKKGQKIFERGSGV